MTLIKRLQTSRFFLGLLFLYALVRFYFGALYVPIKEIITGTCPNRMFTYKFDVLIDYMYHHKPIDLIYWRQPGPPLFFIMYPFLALSTNKMYIDVIGMVLGTGFILLAFWVTYKALFPKGGNKAALILLFALWFCNSSVYMLLQSMNLESWELFFISLFLIGMLRNRHWLAGFGIATASLLKFIPGAFFLLALARNRKVFFRGFLCFCFYLVAGHIAFGPNMGLKFFPTILGRGLVKQTDGLTYFENITLKGLVYKCVGGFKINPDHGWAFLFTPAQEEIAFWIYYGLALIILGSVCWVLYQGYKKNRDTLLEEFGLVSCLMFLLTPGTGLEFTILLLCTFSIGMKKIFFDSKPVQKSETFLFLGSYFLLAHFLPYSWVLKFPLFPYLKEVFHFERMTVDETYKAMCIPTLGIIMLFFFFLLPLIRQTRFATTKEEPQKLHFATSNI